MRDRMAAKNAAWIIGCRIIQAVLSFVISMLTARFLGPSNFGLINYAASITAFLTPVMMLGLDTIVIQEIITNPENEGKAIGTTLIMCFLSGLLCIIGIVCFVFVSSGSDIETLIVCGLYSLLLLAQAIEMIQYWYLAKLLSKYTSIVSLMSYVIVSIYKIFLLATRTSVYWFAISNAIDYLLIGIVLLILYKKVGTKRLEFSFALAKKMVSKSKYYIISGLMVTIFLQTDRIMLKLLIGNSEVGFYSAASACACITSFVFSAIISSMRPVILEKKAIQSNDYQRRITQLYSAIIYASIIQSVLMTMAGQIIVQVIYGPTYAPAVNILRVLVWYTTFSYYGAAKDIWILAEEKQKYLVLVNGVGALMNVILNYMLIPSFGACGAAVASLVTQFFANVVLGFIIPPLRPNNMLLIQALNPKNVVPFFRAIISK